MLNITSGKIPRPQKVVIYGPEGIGKTTFAAAFPDPVFIDTEGGTCHMDVRRVDKPGSWTELIALVKQFAASVDICKTLVIDTADWAEQLCASEVCAKYQKKGIEDFGFGKGYTYLQEEFGKLLNALEDVINAGMNVVVTAHAKMRKFEQPDEMGAYDRWEMKLTKQVAPMVKEWADMVLFANYKTYVVAADDKGQKHKVQGGKRVLYTSHHPCWDAKNRHGLPEEIPLEYGQIAHYIEHRPLHGASQPASAVAAVTPPPKAEPAAEQLSMATSDPGDSARDIPSKVRALMEASNITEAEIRRVFGSKGYYPEDTPWSVLEADGFVAGWIVPQWDNIVSMVLQDRTLPF